MADGSDRLIIPKPREIVSVVDCEALDPGMQVSVCASYYYMADGSLIIDERGKPLRKHNVGSRKPRDMTVDEAARFTAMQVRA